MAERLRTPPKARKACAYHTVVYRFVLGIPSVSTKTTKYLSHFSSAGRKEKGDVNQESESEKAKPLSIS